MESLAQYFAVRPADAGNTKMNTLFGISDDRANEFIEAMQQADQAFEEHLDDLGREQYAASEMIAFLLAAVDRVFKPQSQAEGYYVYFALGSRLEQVTSQQVSLPPFDFNEWVAEMQQQREQRPQSKRPIATA
ncbi:hypothetical protein CLV58_1065 [Spirosoma oryzae]|uniref:Uncharacterized protein n=1 Tax=Spirosoma oryzae TaxID=1469603 RepID=A0A2T0T582_9BACT|nr:hypothetical protein [Spirosoma oryzae]PRY40822.1 hypothetical protein CLV58_1065 [Spirosoma oryzae]